MQVLNKFKKEELVIKMHKEGKTIRQIAAAAHVSFSDIGKIIRKIDGPTNDDSNNCSIMLIIAAAASIGLVTIGSQSTMADDDEAYVDVAETAEAGNVTTMMTNQTANGNTTTANPTS